MDEGLRGYEDDAGCFQLLFGFADQSDFRIGVNDIGDHVVIHVTGLSGENFGDRHAFLFFGSFELFVVPLVF